MKRAWKIEGQKVLLPDYWDLSDVLAFVSLDIKICPFCSKVDVGWLHSCFQQ